MDSNQIQTRQIRIGLLRQPAAQSLERTSTMPYTTLIPVFGTGETHVIALVAV